MTESERRIWNLVRNRGVEGLKFVRQYPVGPYIVDFVCRERMLVVELDGSQHADDQAAYDLRRTDLLNTEGYSVLRFWNNEVLKEPSGVRDLLCTVVNGFRPSPGWRYSPATLSPAGRGDEQTGRARK
jgi:very-short-patch-repair endonuclease